MDIFLSATQIKSTLSTWISSTISRMSSSPTCIICYSPLTNPAILYPCKHSSFCYICILTWLKSYPPDLSIKIQRFRTDGTCPLCRNNALIVRVTTPYGIRKRVFAIRDGLSHARLFSAARAELLRQRVVVVATTTNVALQVFVYVQLRRMQMMLKKMPADDDALERMLLAAARFHEIAYDALMRQDMELIKCILRLLRRMDRIVKGEGDVKQTLQPIGWKIEVIRKLI
ncbi:hypothetical protein K440DRAFT_661885 [Wilcoxina mikolae CBS 423.85]|nr:hypothetical protein K440DRAFT_661885 [Wilcoxina mikolae CBS 423.85]